MKTLLLAGLISLSMFVRQMAISKKRLNLIRLSKQRSDPEVATQKYLNTLTSDQKEKSDSYFEGGYWLMLWAFLYEFVIVWVFLFWVCQIGLRGYLTKSKNINLQNLIYIGFYFLFVYILTFPLTLYQDFLESTSTIFQPNFRGMVWRRNERACLSIIF